MPLNFISHYIEGLFYRWASKAFQNFTLSFILVTLLKRKKKTCKCYRNIDKRTCKTLTQEIIHFACKKTSKNKRKENVFRAINFLDAETLKRIEAPSNVTRSQVTITKSECDAFVDDIPIDVRLEFQQFRVLWQRDSSREFARQPVLGPLSGEQIVSHSANFVERKFHGHESGAGFAERHRGCRWKAVMTGLGSC